MADRTNGGIKYISLYGALGYFVAAKRYMLELLRRDIPLTWTPMLPGASWGIGLEPFSGQGVGDSQLDSVCNRDLAYDTVIIHTPPDLYPLWARQEAGKRLIGYTAWETNRIPSFWPRCMEGLEHLLVPSHWNRDVLRAGGVTTPITVIPHIAKNHTASTSPRRRDKKDFVFYAIETWTSRKNLENTIRLYLETFRRDESVVFMLKTFPQAYRHNRLTSLSLLKDLYVYLRRRLKIPRNIKLRPNADGLLQRLTTRYPDGGRIRLITVELPESGIAALHRYGDCYLSLSRGEGWGMGLFDAAASGNPVITTGYGGQMDYLDPALGHLVGYDLVPARDDDNRQLFNSRQLWAEAQAGEAAARMRQVFEDPVAARSNAEALQSRILREYSPDKIVDRMLAVISGG